MSAYKPAPCPKCGSKDINVARITEVCGIQWFFIACNSCGFSTSSSTDTDTVINEWERSIDNDRSNLLFD